MKRYRWTDFYLDVERNNYRDPDFPAVYKAEYRDSVRGVVEAEYGQRELDAKVDRWLSMKAPSLCAPVEYLDLLHEVERAYVAGSFYASLTGACCLGERILNHLLLRLREHNKASPRYKEVWNKASMDDWVKALGILKDWQALTDEVDQEFRRLLELRNPAVHFGSVDARVEGAAESLNLVYSITSSLFGHKHNRFFWAPGEMYVKKEFETDPITMEFVLPHCHRLGYAHSVQQTNIDGRLCNVLRDEGPYEEAEISDEEFADRRGRHRE